MLGLKQRVDEWRGIGAAQDDQQSSQQQNHNDWNEHVRLVCTNEGEEFSDEGRSGHVGCFGSKPDGL